MLLFHYQNAGQNHDIKIANTSSENVSQFKYLGTTIINQNLIKEEIGRSLNSGNTYYHSVQNFPSSSLLTQLTQHKPPMRVNIFHTLNLHTCGA
jgi:hypothetical protein